MILRSEQIVKYGDGTMKKLEELGEVPEAVLYPDTQVEVEPGEPTIDLEDYVEDIAKDAGGSKWSLLGKLEDILFNTLTNIDASLNDVFTGKYNEILMMMSPADATYEYPVATMIVPGDYLKNNDEWFMFFSTANTAQAIGQTALVYGFQFTEAAGVHKITYKGANHYYNNGTKLNISFYVR